MHVIKMSVALHKIWADRTLPFPAGVICLMSNIRQDLRSSTGWTSLLLYLMAILYSTCRIHFSYILQKS